MNHFEQTMSADSDTALRAVALETIQVNVGLLCNQECSHCHLACSPQRREIMDWSTMELVREAAAAADVDLVDITGGAPELNPHLPHLIRALRSDGRAVQVRTNLTALLAADTQHLIGLFRDYQVRLVASLPCYLPENVDAQRGGGVHRQSIEAVRRLNATGYGRAGGLQLDLVYNPVELDLPPVQSQLEGDFRQELHRRFGITFTNLLTITNVPIGRFGDSLDRQGRRGEYMDLLVDSFNAKTVEALMCRRQISIGWDGTLYDCDFHLAVGRPVSYGAPDHIRRFDPAALAARRIVTADHCFACTAGFGSSCRGALV
ncbi:hypothetical protein LCGC14_0181850 [marine sediment metagenome]|uniref:DUF3641 domain-containing protein n=1 Tax=marine sediment metagenome TaxID=412755 RepID=A0A0F9X819_9ZZZZ|nr:radical SAM/Cys-rich domain protein [Phycisphaerae bacterium]HDZ42543.1 radical SAM/Cys-rich domain protein [Phycisphaerae bacterium]